MPKVVFISKGGEVSYCNIKMFNVETLYKKCKFKDNENFEKRHTWKLDKETNVSLYAKSDGKAGTENKYDLPPPLDKELYYGCMVLCAYKGDDLTKESVQHFDKDAWLKLYEKLMGGFEDLGEDSERSEDEEDIDKDMLTKEGYLKNSFIADDNESVEVNDGDDSEKEYSGDETVSSHDYDSEEDSYFPEENSEMEEEEYEYE